LLSLFTENYEYPKYLFSSIKARTPPYYN